VTEGRTSRVQRNTVEMADGTTFTVRVTNPDYLRWDMTAERRGWGKATDKPFLAQTFVTWCAAKREKATDLGWDDFQESCIQIAALEVDDEADVIRPTNPAATDELS
jgi:hypothetical protein